MSEQFGFGNQIVDITKECTFEWHQEPASCYAFLEVSSASGDFTDDETVTGQNSGATATVFSSYVNGGRVYVTNVNGTFQADETITGSSSSQTATIDEFVAKRSWPDNIIQGTFPDSIISKDVDNYLEWESTGTGSGFRGGRLKIFPPVPGSYIVLPVLGTGVKVDANDISKYIYANCHQGGFPTVLSNGTKIGTFENLYDLLVCFYPGSLVYSIHSWNGIDGFFMINFYQSGAATLRWRIHNIRVLKLVI